MNANAPKERYGAHVALPTIGEEGHARIRQGRAAIVGLGGLGCPAALYLAAAGVGSLTLCDFDRVSNSNLARQILYGPEQVGEKKVESAARFLRRANPDVRIHTVDQRVDVALAASIAGEVDLVLDASDNFATRLAINEACLRTKTPWVMGAAIRFEGQLAVFRPDLEDQPCYRCVYGTAPDLLEDCPGGGVFGPAVGIVGSAMAAQALALLAKKVVIDRLILLDAGRFEWHGLRVTRKSDCEACSDA